MGTLSHCSQSNAEPLSVLIREKMSFSPLREQQRESSRPKASQSLPERISARPTGTPRQRIYRCLLLMAVAMLPILPLWARGEDQGQRLTQMSLEALGNIKVTSVSKEPEQVWKTPA